MWTLRPQPMRRTCTKRFDGVVNGSHCMTGYHAGDVGRVGRPGRPRRWRESVGRSRRDAGASCVQALQEPQRSGTDAPIRGGEGTHRLADRSQGAAPCVDIAEFKLASDAAVQIGGFHRAVGISRDHGAVGGGTAPAAGIHRGLSHHGGIVPAKLHAAVTTMYPFGGAMPSATTVFAKAGERLADVQVEHLGAVATEDQGFADCVLAATREPLCAVNGLRWRECSAHAGDQSDQTRR